MSANALGMLPHVAALGTLFRRRYKVRCVTSLVAGGRRPTANHVVRARHVTTVRQLVGGVDWWNSRAAVTSSCLL